MAGKKKIRIFYRAASHVPLWKVMEEQGFLEKHGLEMDFGSREGERRRAMEELRAGALDIISGNHHNLYARRALHGEPFVHLAEVANDWGEHFMVAGNAVRSVQDLKGKCVCMDDFDSHGGLNVWLFLKQSGLEEGRDVQLVSVEGETAKRVSQVMAGEYDATFVGAIGQRRARALGANVIEVRNMPMIAGVTITTNMTYVRSHEEEVRGLLHALVDAIHFFKTRRRETLDTIDRTCRDLLHLRSDDEVAAYYETHAGSFQPKPYPSLEAIQNVFALAVRQSPEIRNFNPLVLWDLHYLREVDDSGYIDRLYGGNAAAA